MQFDPTADKEEKPKDDSKFATWPDGDYDATVSKIEETTSGKSGKPMLKVTLEVFDNINDRRQYVWDNIVNTSVWKIKQLMNACELADEFMSGNFEPHMAEGKNIRVKLETQPAQNGYKAKNTVKQYLFNNREEAKPEVSQPAEKPKPTGVPVAKQNAAKRAFGDQECPF